MGDKAALGEFEHQVLLAALRLAEAAYTAGIVRELEDRTGREVSAAAVYIALRRMEKAGLVRSRLRRGGEGGDRRERRYFSVTDDGLAMARESSRRLVALWEGLDAVRVDAR